jgi:hypothetical protein
MDIEKTMEFILNAQARLEASAQQHEGRIARLESSMATATDLIGRVAQAEIRLAERMESGFRELREAQAAGMKEFREELREVQASTNYKLNALIDTVDKIVRKNGDEKS